jgi:hypothetical protein
MPSVDIVDLSGAVVGSLELADAVFGADVNEALLYEAVRQYTAARRSGTASTKTYRVPARSCGSKKEQGAPAWAPFDRRYGGTVGPYTDRNRTATNTSCPAR